MSQREVLHMKSDIEIAQQAPIKPISEIASILELDEKDWDPYGHTKAKLSHQLLDTLESEPDGKIILVTSINPTPLGEGKSTVAVGLGQALNRLGKKSIVTLREPSLGPVLGMKGGAAGGGFSQVIPMEDINLHFTGDLHAITSANNALSAFIDHHIHQGNELNIDPRRVEWKRVIDLNDRSLRRIITGLGGPLNGLPREDGFHITVASEMMAILCLAINLEDLRNRISRIVIGYTYDKQPVYVKDLKVEGALTVLLKDAFKPNLVQTLEHTPAIIHGGPFANIAHGCNSVIATKMAAKLGEYVITEAGFGADLGAEKFFHIKTLAGKFQTNAVVIVATIDALKMHGGGNLAGEDIEALKLGITNLKKHIETIKHFGLPYVVAINKFPSDTNNELSFVKNWCEDRGISVALTDVWRKGGEGGIELARQVITKTKESGQCLKKIYHVNEPLDVKIRKIAQNIYGADDIEISIKAKEQMTFYEKQGWSKLPVCIAKTQYSLSDDPERLGRPKGFKISIREFMPSIGAGFIVALTGDVMTMPGLPKKPAALQMDVVKDGQIVGLF